MTTWLFLVPLVVGLMTQFSKRFFNDHWMSKVSVHGYHLPRYGGMPSAHTSFAFSLATTALLIDGAGSVSFAIAAALVIFILDDALRMRVYLSRHGQALNKLIKTLPTKDQKDFPHLEERLGHSPPEVLAGAIVGTTLTALIIYLIKL